jgi:hypothetical protein
MPDRWWDGHPEEIYWVEITDRADLGVDLAAPQLNEEGQPYWSYDLVREVREGDVVVHYAARPTNAITHWSRASGQPYEDSLVWGAHGQASGRGPVTPYERPAWRRPLDGPYPLDQPVTMARLRQAEDAIRQAYHALRAEYGERTPLYFPFQLSDSRPARAFQGYMAKMPRDLLLAIPELAPVVGLAEATRPTPTVPAPRAAASGLGASYRAPDEDVRTRPDRDPHAVDPNLVDRSLRSHARVQNRLAAAIRSAGHEPRSAAAGEPPFDLAWEDGDTVSIAEIKSMSGTNEEKQLRLALGQVLRYEHLLAAKGRPVRTYIAVERKPSDESWAALCEQLGIRLCWPETFASAVKT